MYSNLSLAYRQFPLGMSAAACIFIVIIRTPMCRVREKRDGSFVVSLCDAGRVWHYSIDVRVTDYGDKLRIENGPAFDNLMDVSTRLD